MRIHTDKLDENDMLTAAIHAGVIMHRLSRHRSQSRDHAFDFYLEGSGRSGGQCNTGTRGANSDYNGSGVIAATWDEYGWTNTYNCVGQTTGPQLPELKG